MTSNVGLCQNVLKAWAAVQAEQVCWINTSVNMVLWNGQSPALGQAGASSSEENSQGSWQDASCPGGRSAPMQENIAAARGRDPPQVLSSSKTTPGVLSWARSREQMLTYRRQSSGRSPVVAGAQGIWRKWSSVSSFSLTKKRERGDQAVVTAWWEGTNSAQGCTATGLEVTGMHWNVGKPH